MGLEGVNGLKGARKERKKKASHGQYMMWKSENGPRQAQSNESKESKGLLASPWAPRIRDNAIGPRKSKELSKIPWECKVKKRAKEAQGKQMSQERLRENKWDIGARQWCNKRTNGQEKNKWQAQRPSRIKANNFARGMMEWHGRRW